MIAGDEECRTEVCEVDEEVLGGEDAFGGKLIFGVEEVTSDDNYFLFG